MNHKKLLNYYHSKATENDKKYNSSLTKHYFANVSNGQHQTPPYVDIINPNKLTSSTFSNNRKKRKYDEVKSHQISMSQYEDQPTQYIDGIPSALRGDDGTYRRLHEHISEDDSSYDSITSEWNGIRKHSKNGSYKLIFLFCALFFFLMMYIPVYNQANSKTGECFYSIMYYYITFCFYYISNRRNISFLYAPYKK